MFLQFRVLPRFLLLHVFLRATTTTGTGTTTATTTATGTTTGTAAGRGGQLLRLVKFRDFAHSFVAYTGRGLPITFKKKKLIPYV